MMIKILHISITCGFYKKNNDKEIVSTYKFLVMLSCFSIIIYKCNICLNGGAELHRNELIYHPIFL